MLEFLGQLCVCENTALTINQNYICKSLFVEMVDVMYILKKGEEIGKPYTDALYISTDNQRTWTPLFKFVSVSILI